MSFVVPLNSFFDLSLLLLLLLLLLLSFLLLLFLLKWCCIEILSLSTPLMSTPLKRFSKYRLSFLERGIIYSQRLRRGISHQDCVCCTFLPNPSLSTHLRSKKRSIGSARRLRSIKSSSNLISSTTPLRTTPTITLFYIMRTKILSPFLSTASGSPSICP